MATLPSRIAHYAILGKLGEGGMGVVYRAHDRKNDRPVALKLMWPHLREDPARVEAFHREARVGEALAHPHIAKIYELGRASPAVGVPETVYLVMELIEGRDFHEKFGRRQPEIHEVVDVILQVLVVLAAAHRLGVVHRDLRPGNVRVTPGGQVKLLDFGLATVSGPEKDGGDSPQIVGTPAYLAPELLTAAAAASPRSDLFAVGVLLYWGISGRLPFSGAGRADYVRDIRRGAPSLLSTLPTFVPAVGEGLDSVVSKLLATDPARRYATAHEAFDDLVAVRPVPTPVEIVSSPGSATVQPGWWTLLRRFLS